MLRRDVGAVQVTNANAAANNTNATESVRLFVGNKKKELLALKKMRSLDTDNLKDALNQIETYTRRSHEEPIRTIHIRVTQALSAETGIDGTGPVPKICGRCAPFPTGMLGHFAHIARRF